MKTTNGILAIPTKLTEHIRLKLASELAFVYRHWGITTSRTFGDLYSNLLYRGCTPKTYLTRESIKVAERLKDMAVRSTIEIVFDILEVADRGSLEGHYDDIHKDGVMQIEIIYKEILGYNQLKEYLKVLTENDLLSFDSATRKFKITQKGRRFVQIYNKMSDLVKEGLEQQI